MFKDTGRETKTATEYRLSISSNPGSRRSSIGGSGDHAGNNGVANNNLGSNEMRDTSMVDTFLLPQIQELTDSVITLDSNFTHMNFIHESLVDLNESVSALLYGLMCNSWCVDFPNLPHDTAGELAIKKELNQLARERESLMAELHGLDNEPSAVLQEKEPNATKSKLQFAKPLHPSMFSTMMTTHNVVTEEEEDEDNTAASFVSNPTIMNLKPPTAAPTKNAAIAGPLTAHTKSMKNKRRYSILNQIRNIDITGHKSNNSIFKNTTNSAVSRTRSTTHPLPASNNEKRKSLAVSASRISNKRPQQLRPTSAVKAAATRRRHNITNPTNSGMVPHSASAATSTSHAVASRPPFR
ncbi:Dam1p Ecym_1254 [Eremothecium cymbalariae DBVPG|uniref:DASH complex subunit DAM1 n=1 Tax=Eremothecium cymbalariae (strain CBS 270.75 / DBVPG 7215 / KCTC 17166 / NRRL Y-17582) TaxID=931890 RepID=G8JN32_ERECY|nr:hypothetical protein Ecym_1254 [Eremothecium cymbalariae DBVPG\